MAQWLSQRSQDVFRDAREFLESDDKHVVAVHCKAGKGRTGICIAALLLSLGKAHTWSAALAQFAIMRTDNCVGVTIASQRRWVQYYDAIRDQPAVPPPCPIRLRSVRIGGLPGKYANRVIIVVQERAAEAEHERTDGSSSQRSGNASCSGRLPRTVAVANLPPPLTSTSSMFGSFMCGQPACGGLETPPAPTLERSTSSGNNSNPLAGAGGGGGGGAGGIPFARDSCGAGGGGGGGRRQSLTGAGWQVHHGSGWRLSHAPGEDLVLDLETDEVRPRLHRLGPVVCLPGWCLCPASTQSPDACVLTHSDTPIVSAQHIHSASRCSRH